MTGQPWQEVRSAHSKPDGRLGWSSQWTLQDWPTGFQARIYRTQGVRQLRLDLWDKMLYKEKVVSIAEGKKIAEAVLAVIQTQKGMGK